LGQDINSVKLPHEFRPADYNAVVFAFGQRIDVAGFTDNREQGILYLNGDVFAPASKRPEDLTQVATERPFLNAIPFYHNMCHYEPGPLAEDIIAEIMAKQGG
jgi:hypothetical protein